MKAVALVQPSLFSNEMGTQGGVWHNIPLHKFITTPEARVVPTGTILDLDLSRETPESLSRLSNRELFVLCRWWGCPSSGTKQKKGEILINRYRAAQKIKGFGEEGLKTLTVAELKSMLRTVGRGSGAYLNKSNVINSLLNWREKVHEPFIDQVAEAKHYEAVRKALAKGIAVPDEVIRGNKLYVNMERKAKGLTLAPTAMTTREWVSYLNRAYGFSNDYMGLLVNEQGAITEHSKREYHWMKVEQAFQKGQRLPLKVIDDHVQQTQGRIALIEKSIPRGPGWEPVKFDNLRIGDMLRKADGTEVRVIDIPSKEVVKVHNCLYDFIESYEVWQLWKDTPFRRGDKVEWISPSGQKKIGRIQFSRCQTNGFGEEFYIHTGEVMASFPDQWAFFTAPTTEVRLIEINYWAREGETSESKTPSFKEMDYVSWEDYDGRPWAGHVWNEVREGEKTATVWLYHLESGPLHGPKVILVLSQNPTLKKTTQKFEANHVATTSHIQYWEEYYRKPNQGAWRFMIRLHDLFGLPMPEIRHRVYEGGN